MTTSERTFRQCDTMELMRQIGVGNLMAISGGRVIAHETGVTLPVGSGYSVTVDLDPSDTYVVRRVFKRGDQTWVKGELDDVYADQVPGKASARRHTHQVGEIAYQAHAFRSYDFPVKAELDRGDCILPAI